MLFVIALAGLAILYLVLRLRIAYSVKRVPTYDHNTNAGFILGLSSLSLVYALVSAHLFSSRTAFMNNKVTANESHVWYYANENHPWWFWGEKLTPGAPIFCYLYFSILMFAFQGMMYGAQLLGCKCAKWFPDSFMGKHWNLNKIVINKACSQLFRALSNKQREEWLREEVGTRLRTGI